MRSLMFRKTGRHPVKTFFSKKSCGLESGSRNDISHGVSKNSNIADQLTELLQIFCRCAALFSVEFFLKNQYLNSKQFSK